VINQLAIFQWSAAKQSEECCSVVY